MKILNSKEKKNIIKILRKQYGYSGSLDFVLSMNDKNRIYIINEEISRIDLDEHRINTMGMYLGELTNDEIRLSIEGSMIVGKEADKNIVEIDEKDMRRWVKGQDLEKELDEKSYVILRSGKDYLGSGKAKKGMIINYVPKTRRINSLD